MESHDQEQAPNKYDFSTKNAKGSDNNDQEQDTHVYEFGDFRLNPRDKTKFRLLRNGQPHTIQDKPFRLLCVLVENRDRELSNEELIGYLWPGDVVDADSRDYYVDRLHHHVRKLRERIGRKMVESRKGGGAYFFTREVEVKGILWTPPPPPAEDLEFQQWIVGSNECRWIKLFLGVGVAFSLLYSIAYLLRDLTSYTPFVGHNPVEVLSLVQLAVVTGALIGSIPVFDRNLKEFPASSVADAELMRISGYTDREKWGRAKDGAKSSRKQFSLYWKMLLVAWVCLYLLLSWLAYLKDHGGPNITDEVWGLKIASTVFNNFNSWAIALCFIVFNHPTVFRTRAQGIGRTRPGGTDVADEPAVDGTHDTSLLRLTRRVKVWGLLAVLVFAAVEYPLVFYPRTQWFSSWTSDNVLQAADTFSGIVGAVALALFVGRIQSKFLGPSTWLPLAFFVYVSIQSLFVAIGTGESWAPAVIEAALILKCLMYLYMAWLFKSGRLLFYLVRVKTVYERVNIEWQEFLANLNRIP